MPPTVEHTIFVHVFCESTVGFKQRLHDRHRHCGVDVRHVVEGGVDGKALLDIMVPPTTNIIHIFLVELVHGKKSMVPVVFEVLDGEREVGLDVHILIHVQRCHWRGGEHPLHREQPAPRRCYVIEQREYVELVAVPVACSICLVKDREFGIRVRVRNMNEKTSGQDLGLSNKDVCNIYLKAETDLLSALHTSCSNWRLKCSRFPLRLLSNRVWAAKLHTIQFLVAVA